MEKAGSYKGMKKEFTKLRRKVRAIERQGKLPSEKMMDRLIVLDGQLMESGTWYSNFKNEQ